MYGARKSNKKIDINNLPVEEQKRIFAELYYKFEPQDDSESSSEPIVEEKPKKVEKQVEPPKEQPKEVKEVKQENIPPVEDEGGKYVPKKVDRRKADPKKVTLKYKDLVEAGVSKKVFADFRDCLQYDEIAEKYGISKYMVGRLIKAEKEQLRKEKTSELKNN